MNDDPKTKPGDDNEVVERDIRTHRTFSLNDAIGQMSGGDFMKGGSPVSRTRQAELEVDEYLRRHLADSGGVLRIVLLRRLGGSLIKADYDRPLVALAEVLPRVLASDHLLEDLVREADEEWGRVQGERPYFQGPGRAPHPDDPYTIDSVRRALVQLRETLASGAT